MKLSLSDIQLSNLREQHTARILIGAYVWFRAYVSLASSAATQEMTKMSIVYSAYSRYQSPLMYLSEALPAHICMTGDLSYSTLWLWQIDTASTAPQCK